MNTITPPKNLELKVKAAIHARLQPQVSKVFLKLGAVHLLLGPLTLLFCPQFNLSPLNNMGLTHFYMQMGETACTVACGITYVFFTLLIVSFILSPEEIRILRKTKLGLATFMGSLSLGFFVMFGAEVFASLTLWWLLGAIAGSVGTLELGWKLKQTLT